MHPHTVFYSKASEGALYSDSSHGKAKADDNVASGHIQTYIWVVTEEGAPAEGDPNCLTWLYHSHIKPTKDINSGPVGKYHIFYRSTVYIYNFISMFGMNLTIDTKPGFSRTRILASIKCYLNSLSYIEF